MSTQGRRLTSKTRGKPRTQIPLWMQRFGFQRTVISPLVYRIVGSSICKVYPVQEE
jgi:hypothetical protein